MDFKERKTILPINRPKQSGGRWYAVVILAVGIFLGIGGFFYILTSETYQIQIPEDIAEYAESTPAPTSRVGDIIQFGDHNWRVLDVRSDRILIITENIIGTRHYHHTDTNVTWATSDIRSYLNSTFFNTFSAEDRARILETTVINNNNPWDFSDWDGYVSTPGGPNTTDRIFLLSIDEVLTFFGDSDMVARGATMSVNERSENQPAWPNHGIYDGGIHDQFSNARIAYNAAGSASWWWLRSPGLFSRFAAYIYSVGFISMYGFDVSSWGGGIRPALWLSLTP